jgi:hypothetical protein
MVELGIDRVEIVGDDDTARGVLDLKQIEELLH